MSIDDAFNVGVETGDFTLGDKTTAAGDGAVSVGGNNTGGIVSGDGAVVGSGNHVNNGNILAGDGSPVTFGDGNEVHATSQMAKGDIIQDNEGPVIKDVDTHGGGFDLDNHTTVFGNQTEVHAGGDINGDVDASNTSLQNVGNTDASLHNVGNTTGSFNETGSHNTTTDVTGLKGGDIGVGDVDAGGLLGGVAGGVMGGPVGLLGGAAEGLGDLVDDFDPF